MYNVERGEIAASTEITAVHLDKVAHKACPFPPAVRDKAQALLATGDWRIRWRLPFSPSSP